MGRGKRIMCGGLICAAHNYISIHFSELLLPSTSTSEQNNTIPIQFVDSYLWL